MSKYYLAEAPFWSIQGEGLRTGSPTIFIRLAGCNADESFQCWKFCDTKWARVKKGSPQVSAENIIRMIKRLPKTEWVDITGGEPNTYDLSYLVKLLKDEGYLIQVETNGTLYQDIPIDHWTVSPKTSYVEEIYWGVAKEFKWVVSEEEDLERIQIPNYYWGKTYLQPNSNHPKAIEICLEALKEHPNWALSLQIHKILGVK